MKYHHKPRGHQKTVLIMVGVTYTQAQLDAMGLSPSENTDEILGGGTFTRRLQLQNAVKTTNQVRVTQIGDDIFATKKPVHQKSARCNIPINLIHCTAVIPGAGAGGVDKVLPGDTYIFHEENLQDRDLQR